MTGERQKKSSKNGISYLRTAELEKFANTLKSKKQYGGDQVSGVEESWDLVNDLLNQSAPLNLGPPGQVGGRKNKKSYSLYGGGEQTSGATFLPAQWNTPNAPLPRGNNPSQINGAYGRINAVSGMDVNLSAFPDSSMQQTGGAKKPNKAKPAKKATEKKPVKKEKKAKKGEKDKKAKDSDKKSTSIWSKIKSFF
jgi:hypothetical protein